MRSLGLVHCPVGTGDQLLWRQRVKGERRDSETGRQRKLQSLSSSELMALDLRPNAVGNLHRFIDSRLWQD